MAAAYPDGLWISILAMAAIILALLWSDKISGGSSGTSSGSSSSSTGGTEPTPEPETERGPSITATDTGDRNVGGSFGIRGTYSTGSEEQFDIEAEINGSQVRVEAEEGNFQTNEENVVEGTNEYRAVITNSAGQDADGGTFEASKSGSRQGKPRVSIEEIQKRDEEGYIRIVAEAEPAPDGVPIAWTGMEIKDVQSQESPRGDRTHGERYELERSGLSPSVYQFTAMAEDEEGRTAEPVTDNLVLEGDEGTRGPGRVIGSGSGHAPIIYNPQILESQAGNLPDELIEALEDLAASIRDKNNNPQAEVELEDEIESLVEAIEGLSDSLSGDELEDIIDELVRIRQAIESRNDVDLSGIEDRLDRLIIAIRNQGTPDDSDGSGGSGDSNGGADIEILDLEPRSGVEGMNTSEIGVDIFAQANPGDDLGRIEVEFHWPNGSQYESELNFSGQDMFRQEKTLSELIEQEIELSAIGNYGLRLSVFDTGDNTDSDYDTIVINKQSSTNTMASIEDLHDQQDREIELFHQGMKDLKQLHEDHKEEVEIETELLDEAKEILEMLNDLEHVEEAIRNHLITDLGETRNLGPRKLRSMSEQEIEEMASQGEITQALQEAIASVDFHGTSDDINTSRDLRGYVSNLRALLDSFQETLNNERQHQSRDNSLLQKLEGDVEDGLQLEKKNAQLVEEFLQNAGTPKSGR